MYIDHKENENDPGTRFCLNASRADIANIALNLNNITTETNVPVYFNNGTPSQIIEIPNSLIGDLSDKYLSVTKGGTVNGNVTADTFIGKLQGEADTAKVADYAQSADYANDANGAIKSLDSEAAVRAMQTGAVIAENEFIIPEHIRLAFLQEGGGFDLSLNYGTSMDVIVQNLPFPLLNGTIPLAKCHFKWEMNKDNYAVLMQIVTLVDIEDDKIAHTEYVRTARMDGNTLELIDTEWSDWVPYGIIPDNEEQKDYLPLTAGEEYKISGPLGFTNASYGSVLPATGFEGQLFFLEEEVNGGTPIYVPEGGNIGTVLTKNSDEDGDISWKEIVALPKGGNPGQVLVKNTAVDGDASWTQADYLPLTGGTITGGLVLNSQDYTDPVGQNFAIGIEGSDSAVSGMVVKNSTQGITLYLTPDGYMGLADLTGNTIVYKNPQGHYHLGPSGVYSDGSVLFGAAWNDYAEYRSQKETIEPGYCVASADNGQVYRTTEKFQACDGIVSDTFGFAIGETDECKTPLAVAGRVLAYCEGNRYDYHSGDTVCAGPDGKVCKMTREEIREWPDRIVGIVSEIPEYERWGSGNIEVNGRIWIKIR